MGGKEATAERERSLGTSGGDGLCVQAVDGVSPTDKGIAPAFPKVHS